MNETTDKKIYQSQIERYDILFLQKGSNWNYNTINTSSLRGTENAIYQLSLQLSKKYKVAVLTNGGIHHSLNENLVYDNIQRVNNYTNVSIVIHMAYPFTYEYFHKNTVHFIYIQHDITVSFIKKFYKNIDFLKKIIYKFIFVSDWQKNKYVECYDIEDYKCVVMQNAINPVLELPQQSINKKMTLVYASSPYRGLTIILPVFNKLLQHFPNLRLKIFSAFKIENKNKDYTPITDLNSYTLSTCIDSLYINYYNTFINHENIDYYGNVPQEILFKHMKESMILYYPNTFPETCCTTVLEALACRCIVVSSKLGALPQCIVIQVYYKRQ